MSDVCSDAGAHVCVNTRMLLVVCLGLYQGLCHALYYTCSNGAVVAMATTAGGAAVPQLQRLRSLLAPHPLLHRWGEALGRGGAGMGGVRTVMAVVAAYAMIGEVYCHLLHSYSPLVVLVLFISCTRTLH